jgi:hypothetical protein
MRRIGNAIERAGRDGRLFHLWWHPHNFGVRLDDNIAFLRGVLERFDRTRQAHGMQSLTMGQVAEAVGVAA